MLPQLVTAIAGVTASGLYDLEIGSRILGGGRDRRENAAAEIRNETRVDAAQEGAALGHAVRVPFGLALYPRAQFEMLNSDDFVFDNPLLAQVIVGRFWSGEISAPTHHFADASAIDFPGAALLARRGVYRHPLFVARRPA
jgi:hypothetical protein